MRGEDTRRERRYFQNVGSPPHARGRPSQHSETLYWTGITPACAGKTGASYDSQQGCEDHPRMRGEDREAATPAKLPGGSPPHARGRPHALT